MALVIRPLGLDELSSVFADFERTFGEKRSLAEWSWRYADNPWGSRNEAAFDSAGRLVAHCGVLCFPWQRDGQLELFGQGVDVFTREVPGLDRRGPMVRTIGSLFDRTAREGRIGLLYGFPNRRAARLGNLGGLYPWVEPMELWQPGSSPSGPKRRGWLQVGWDRSGIEELWLAARRRYRFAAIRNAGFYEHRIRARPGVEYQFLGWRRRGRLHALAVVRNEPTGALRWVDLLWDGADPGDLAALAAGLREEARGRELELWLRGDPEASAALFEWGWRVQPHPEARVVARSFLPGVPHEAFARAYLTLADSDLA